MRITVTGGAGFIGSHIVDAYVSAGHEVSVIDDLSSGHRGNLNARARFYEVDIRSPDAADVLRRERPELLNHQAAQMDVRKSVADPAFDADVNVLGFLNLLEHGRALGLRRVLFASSGGAIYGEQRIFPAPESHPTEPICPYGVTKLAGERYLHFYAVQYGLSYIAFRYANVYGPRQDPHGEAGVVAILSEKMLEGRQPIVYGDGEQTRDYVYVEDVVRAHVAALESEYSGPMNLGAGEETSVNTLFDLLRDLCGSSCERRHAPARPGEQRRSSVDPALAERVLGWTERAELRRGLERAVAYFRQRRSQ